MNNSLINTKNWVAGYPPVLYNQVYYGAGYYIYYDSSPTSPSLFVCEKKGKVQIIFSTSQFYKMIM